MADQNPILTEKEKKIIEPVSRSKIHAYRYASISDDEKLENAVVEPSNVMVEGGQPQPPSEGKYGGRFKGRDKLPAFGHLNDSVNIYDQKNQDWEMGWEHRFNRRHHHYFFSNVNQTTNATVFSDPFYCAPYRWALILINIGLIPPDGSTWITIWPEFSWDGVSFFQFRTDWWGMERIINTMTPYRQSAEIPILAPWIRIAYTTNGASAAVFCSLVTITGIFNSV
jgi:hypothetical protein